MKGAGPQHTTLRLTAEKWRVMEKKVWGFSRGFVYNDSVTIPSSHKSRLGSRKMAQKWHPPEQHWGSGSSPTRVSSDKDGMPSGWAEQAGLAGGPGLEG